MKIAILAATHGNEPLGLNVLRAIEGKTFKHQYEGFIGNPLALEKKVRYVDTDLNRCFGPKGVKKGIEAKRANELTELIKDKFDFLLDIHTTTSEMGITVILTSDDPRTRKAAAYLKQVLPELKIIETQRLGQDCTYTNYLSPSSLTIEVGGTANNIIRSHLFLPVLKMVEAMLEWNEDDIDLSKVEYYKSYEDLYYPEKNEKWMVHPSLEGRDFELLSTGSPLYININGEEVFYQGEDTYPIFINEAAYQELFLSMTLTRKESGWA